MAVSGELTTATSFLVEHAPSHRRGLAGSLAMCSAFIGIVTSAAIASSVTELVSDRQLYTWGWRVPFLIGGVIGIIGLIIRLKTTEPSIYEEVYDARNGKTRPSVWSHLLSLNYYAVLLAIMLTSIMAIGNYFLIGYFNTFLIKTQGFPLRLVMITNFICLATVTILMPLAGLLSDYIGRKPVLMMGMIGFIFLSYPIFLLMTNHNIWIVFIGELLFALVLSPVAGVIPTTLAELFDTYNRNTGLSVSYNLSLALFGGTAPLAAMALVALTGTLFAPAWYIMISASLGLFVLSLIPEKFQRPLG